jgi:hypothetical protein
MLFRLKAGMKLQLVILILLFVNCHLVFAIDLSVAINVFALISICWLPLHMHLLPNS